MGLIPSGQLSVFPAGAARSAAYDITAATLVRAGSGYVATVIVQVAGTGTGTVNDCATTGAAAITNQVAVIPETVGSYQINWPYATGLVITPGTGQTIAVSYV